MDIRITKDPYKKDSWRCLDNSVKYVCAAIVGTALAFSRIDLELLERLINFVRIFKLYVISRKTNCSLLA